MRLTPKDPPGRVNRKARAFELEIVRLRSEDYTCEAIRKALADIGVVVSLSTVQREVARSSKQPSPVVMRGWRRFDGPSALPVPSSRSA